jgi:holo-[acyl-carrier protein] synthase
VRIGTDIADIGRFTSHAAALPGGAAVRYLAPAELDEASARGDGRAEYLASRFAAKEAVMKSLGCGMDKVSFKDIEVASTPDGRPFIRLFGRACERAVSIGAATVLISISHGKEYAVAFAAAVSEDVC